MGSLGEAVLDLTADASKLGKGLAEGKSKISESVGGMKSQLSAFGVAAGTMMGNAAYSAITSISGAIVTSLKNSWQGYMDYAVQVRNTTRSLGVGAEEASRLIQVADDVTISYDSLAIAMKIAQKNGIDPSIEGLAKLSDQYLQLAPGVERTQFLLDTFGKSGQEMGKLMEKGGEGIRSMSAGIEESMILTQQALDAQREYEISVDALSDAWTGFTYIVMPPLIKGATSVMTTLRDWAATADILGSREGELSDITLKNVAASFQEAVAQREAADSIAATSDANKDATGTFDASTSAIGDNKAAVDAAGKAYDDFKSKIDEVSKANQEAEGFIQKYSDFQKGYNKEHKKAIDDVAKAEKELADAQKKYGTEFVSNAKKKGFAQSDLNEAIKKYGANSEEAFKAQEKLNNIKDAQGDNFEGLDKVAEKLQDAKQGVQDLQASWHENTQKMIYDMVLAKVSVDGLTDAEFNATQDLAVSMGIRTQAEAEAAKKMMETASALAAGIAVQENVMKQNKANADELARLEAEKQAAIGGTTTTAVAGAAETTNAQVNSANTTTTAVQNASQTQAQSMGAVTNATMTEVNAQKTLQTTVGATIAQYLKLKAAAAGSGGTPVPGPGGMPPPNKRDSGGAGKAGMPYMIGTGAQPELFIPSVDGTFIPNADAKAMMAKAFADLGAISGAGFSQGYAKSMAAMNRGTGSTQNTSRTNHTNVTINNPVAEPASRSVDKTLKNLSYLGVIK
jgi:hypothetical protein